MEAEPAGVDDRQRNPAEEVIDNSLDVLISISRVTLERFGDDGDIVYLDTAIRTACIAGRRIRRGDEMYEYSVDFFIAIALELLMCENDEDGCNQNAVNELNHYIILFEDGDNLDPTRHLRSRASYLFHRYRRRGREADVDEAVQLQRQVVDLTVDKPDQRCVALCNLGTYLAARWALDPDLNYNDLDDAIVSCEAAVSETPAGDPERAMRLHSLASVLDNRYDHRHENCDLDRGIATLGQALESGPSSPTDKAEILGSLGNMLQSRFERARLPNDLDKAIELGEEALALTPKPQPSHKVALDSLGNKYSLRFEVAGKPEDLRASLSLLRKSVEVTAEGSAGRVEALNNLATALWTQYLSTECIAPLEESIELLRKASAAAVTARSRSICSQNLGFGLRLRFARIGNSEDLEESSRLVLESWNSQGGAVFTRVRSAAVLLQILPTLGRLEEAAQVAQQVVGLLPTVDKNSLSADDLQHFLSTFMDIASGACAVLLEHGPPESAIYCLERSRAVALGHEMDQRAHLLRLRGDHQSWAQRLEGLLKEVNRAASLDQVLGVNHSQFLEQRRSTYRDLQECVEEIRKLPGNSDFFGSLTISEIQGNAAGGSIVFVNVAELRSDAIIVTPSEVKVLGLPKLRPDEARERMAETTPEGRSLRAIRRRNKHLRDYLSWLWDACVQVILADDLVRAQAVGDLPPRVWWIGCGIAASMPFHAAGISGDPSENAYARSISSYAPSVKALDHARRRQSVVRRQDDSILVVTMETTPDEEILSSAISEKDVVLHATGGDIPFKHLAQPSCLEITEALRNCTMAHFACHAGSHPVDPRRSCLIFQSPDESGRPEQDHLTVSDIRGLHLSDARIAFLNACQTGENKAADLADEVTHLVTAFQVAGFAHVIGSLWLVRDGTARDVAEGFYSAILQAGGKRFEGPAIALALRNSVMAIRDLAPEAPTRWAPFIHVGP